MNAFDHVQEKLGEIWSMMEMTRAGVIAAEAGSFQAEGSDDWVPDERSFVALRGLMPKWVPRSIELLQLIGGGGFMATPVEGGLRRTRRSARSSTSTSRRATPAAERRIRAFRLAWDFVGSSLGGRGELYERFYLSDSFRMTALAYILADKEHPTELVEQFLQGLTLLMRVDPIEFRNVMGQFATGVTVLTTVHEGELHGMTANSVTSVSLDPLLILVCLMREARTALAIQNAERLAVNILGEHQEELSRRFAKAGRRITSRGSTGRGPARPAAPPGLPRLHDRPGHEVVEAGDHDVVFAEVDHAA